jgi:FAD/FMN-containing dehydrogenase
VGTRYQHELIEVRVKVMSYPEWGSSQRFSYHDIANLDSRLLGDAVHPEHPDYQRVRRVWNYMIDRRPGLVVRCRNDADVATAIGFAREHDVVLTVKGGGHSVAGHSMVDDGVVIDLSALRHATVDPGAGRVRVGGGCLLADVDRATQAYGLATPAGVVSQTGVGGLALGGGMGWLTRKHGLTCDNLISARVVLADGSRVIASADENPDLYWGLRGAGFNFGVVTEFEFTTHPVGTTVPIGVAVYRLSDAAEAIAHYEQTMRRACDDLKVLVYLHLASAELAVPDDLLGMPVCEFMSVWTGDPADAEQVNKDLWGGAPTVFADTRTMPYLELQSHSDAIREHGACNYTKGGYLGAITGSCIEALIVSAGKLLSSDSGIEVSYQHGAQDRLSEDDTAFSDRHADHLINVVSRWDPADEWQPHIDWARGVHDATSAWHTGGLYTNFMAIDDDERVKEAYRGGKYERLAKLKSRYDPDNIFHKNPNIRPCSM